MPKKLTKKLTKRSKIKTRKKRQKKSKRYYKKKGGASKKRKKKGKKKGKKNKSKSKSKITKSTFKSKITKKVHSKISELPFGEPIYQLFTDVDDTLHPSGWAKLGPLDIAGVDSGDRHKLYDCVKQLHKQINGKYGLPTVVVSANPIPEIPILNPKSKKLGNNLGIDIQYNCGNLGASCRSVMTNTMRKTFFAMDEETKQNLQYKDMADVKVNTISKNVKTMREKLGLKEKQYRPIWIGDNGQGDLLAAKTLLEKKIIYAALIHFVDDGKVSGKSSHWFRNEDPPLLFPFKDYGQAITHLKKYEGLNYLDNCEVSNKSISSSQN